MSVVNKLKDLFRAQPATILSSAEVYEEVAPADVDLAHVTREIRIGGAGDLVVLRLDGTTVTFHDMLAGEHLTIRATQIKAATTCTFVGVLY